MNELLAAATRMCTAIAVHYEKLNGGAAAPAAVAAEPKPARTKKEKAETRGQDNVPGEPETQRPAPAAPAALTEKESEERLTTVGEAFVQRFSKQDDAVGEVFKRLADTYKVARLRDLKHPQRLDLIAYLEARIKEIDSKTTLSAAAPVGL